MTSIVRVVLALMLQLPIGYAAAQETPQSAAERCKDIEQQGPNKIQPGAGAKPEQPASDKMAEAGGGTLNAVAPGSGGEKSEQSRSGTVAGNERDAMGAGTQDCVIYVNPNEKPQ